MDTNIRREFLKHDGPINALYHIAICNLNKVTILLIVNKLYLI